MAIFLLTLAAIGVAMLFMAVGIIFKYPCLRGSCSDFEIMDQHGQALSCVACPRRTSDLQSNSRI